MNKNVVGKKHLKYYSEALIKIDESMKHYNEIKDMNNDKIKSPNIEDIMYYYVKGES